MVLFDLGAVFGYWVVGFEFFASMNDCCYVFLEILHLGFKVLVFVSVVCGKVLILKDSVVLNSDSCTVLKLISCSVACKL